MEISQLAGLFRQKYAEQQRRTIRELLRERRPSTRPFGQQLAVISRLMDKYADEEAQSAALDVVLRSGVYERLENHAAAPDYTDRLFDNPTLYCDGWGKKMSYVFAVSAAYIADVSPKYIKKGQLPRNRLGEHELADTLAYINLCKWIGMDDDDLLATLADFLGDYKSRRRSPLPAPTGPLVPRQSGAPEWTRSRGEDGSRKRD
ncbi:hypothetical protein KL921_003004 [Ogataea angusta]|nr:hypothetical protein KL921_003004 [Ogataea angusta]